MSRAALRSLVLFLVAWVAAATALRAAENSLEVGDMVIANYRGAGGVVARVNPLTGVARKLGTFALPTDVALAGSGAMYVSQWDGGIKRLNLTNGVVATVTSSLPLSQVWGLVVGPGGDLFLTTGVSNRVIRLNPNTGVATVITSGGLLDKPIGIAVLDDTHVVVASTLNNQIVSIDITDGTQLNIAPGTQGIDQPWGVAVFGNNTYLGAHDSTLLQVISAGAMSTVATMGATPLGIGVDAAGNIATGLSGGLTGPYALKRVTPQGLSIGDYSGPLIGEVAGLEIAPVTVVAAEQANTPPLVTAVTPVINLNEGSPLGFTVTATDTNWPVQTLTFSLDAGAPAGAVISSGGGFSWNPSEAQGPGSYPITIRVTDSGTPPLSAATSLTINVAEVNTAPVLDVITNRTVYFGDSVAFNAVATDTDLPAQSLTFTLSTNAATGATLSTNGVFQWTPSAAQVPSTNSFTITVKDSGTPVLGHTRTFSIIVRPQLIPNAPPLFGAIGDRVVNEFELLSFNITATDTNQPPQALTFQFAATPPTGATLSTAGAFRWTPDETQGPSTNVLRVKVTDNGYPSLSTTQSFVVTVTELNSPPSIAALPNRIAREGSLLSFDVTATDADLPAQALTFAIVDGPASGPAITTGGHFTWTPGAADVLVTNRIRIRASDGGSPSLSATQQFDVVTLPAISIRTGDVLAADYGGGAVVRIRPSTGDTRLIDSFNAPTDLVLTTDNQLYVAEESGSIHRLNLNDGTRAVVNPVTTMSSVWGMVLATNGDLYATCSGSDSVMRIDPLSGVETILSSGALLSAPAGIEFRADGVLIVASFNSGGVTEVSVADGSQAALPSHPLLNYAWGVATSGTNVFVAGFDSGAIARVTAARATLFATNLGTVHGIAVAPNGDVFAGVSGGATGLRRFNSAGEGIGFTPTTTIGPLSGLTIAASAIGNRPPLPAAPQLQRYPLLGAKLRVSEFIGSDPDGDGTSLLSAGPVSTHGGTVSVSEGWVIYAPASGDTNADSFTFVVTDALGASSTGVASVTIRNDAPPAQNIRIELLPGGGNRLLGDGIPGLAYTIEYSAGVNPANWLPLTSVVPDATGAFEFIDQPPANSPARFYRTVRP